MFIAFFAVGLLIGAIFGRRWALAFPVAVVVWALMPPWHGVGIEVPPWFVALVFGGSAAAGVCAGALARRLARRHPESV
jgi:hypothetical protein